MTAKSGAVALAIGVFVPSLAVYPGVRQGIAEAISGGAALENTAGQALVGLDAAIGSVRAIEIA
jgi:hypothetical protein